MPARAALASAYADLCSGHNDANKDPDNNCETGSTMPSLVRFLTIFGVLMGLVSAGLYVLATRYEPVQTEVTKPVPNVKIRRP